MKSEVERVVFGAATFFGEQDKYQSETEHKWNP